MVGHPLRQLLLATVLLAPARFSPAAELPDWDGVWASGFASGWPAVRVTFVGNELIGFFWNGDYLDMRASLSTSDGVVTITWTRGQAILTRDGPTQAHLLVLQKGKANIALGLAAAATP